MNSKSMEELKEIGHQFRNRDKKDLLLEKSTTTSSNQVISWNVLY